MKRLTRLCSLALSVALLCACSIDLPQAQTNPTRGPAQTPSGQTLEQTTPPAASATQTPPSSAALPKTQLPMTWSTLALQGRLVFLSAIQKDNHSQLNIQELDLATGGLTSLFAGAETAWIYSAAVSPDGSRLVMSYTPPYAKDALPTQWLYALPMDGSAQPAALFPSADPSDQYMQPEWSPDGKYLYYTHVNYKNSAKDQHYPTVEIFRILYPDGKPEKIADKAFWPRFSKDGKRLVFISSDIDTGKNKIFVADADGQNAQEVRMSGANPPDIIDAPLFSSDGQAIWFSAPVAQTSSVPGRTWMDRLLGITVAAAHSVPSEWWSVPVQGGPVSQQTHLGLAGLFASFAPDGQHMASYSSSQLLVLNADASGATQILTDLGGIYGTVNWIP